MQRGLPTQGMCQEGSMVWSLSGGRHETQPSSLSSFKLDSVGRSLCILDGIVKIRLLPFFN